jgi:flavin-dependent dehydrogenase
METIGIAGGGISGLTAAIHLAKNGFPVTVYEKGTDVASRFTAEFQGLENWSTDEDVLVLLERIGISPHFYCRSFYEVEAIDDLEQRYTVRTDGRAGIYLVKRGREPDSIDQYLKRAALELGVKFRFGRSPEDREVHILAKGPQSIRSIAYGIRADVRHDDRIAILLDDRIAPKCYAYLIIVDGKMILVSTLMRDFYRAKACFSATFERVKRMFGVDPKDVRPFKGHFDFGLRASYVVDGQLLVGECGGFQDYLFGFGMRYALISGHLAARSIIEGLNYDQLVQQEIEKPLRSSLVNRYVFEKLGNWGYRRLVHRWERSDDVLRLMKRWYGWRGHKGLLLPLAMRWLDRKEDSIDS